jgi:hypothetical protein
VLNAKLFAGLAGITFVITVLGRLRVLPRADLWLHLGSVSFGAPYWQLFIVLVCGFFGFAYFGVVRLTQRPLNKTTGLMGFLLVAFGSVVWLIAGFLTKANLPRTNRFTVLLLVAIASFILGVAFSTANVVWFLLRK